MVDEDMADDLRSFGKKILVLGDPGQLPPINGQGAFTEPRAGRLPAEIHRQAADAHHRAGHAGAAGQAAAHRLRAGGGQGPAADQGDAAADLPRGDAADLRQEPVRWVYTQRIRKLRGFEGTGPEVGERLICCRNNREEGLFNGGMGTLQDIQSDHDGMPGTLRWT